MTRHQLLQVFVARQRFGISATFWDFGNVLGFRQRFGISATFWDFGNVLGFRQQFGISAAIWDFGNDLGFGIWDLGFSANCRNYISAYTNPKLISAYIDFGTQV
jgi:hypothetical protein